jgi:hypothetical protein
MTVALITIGKILVAVAVLALVVCLTVVLGLALCAVAEDELRRRNRKGRS